MGTVERMGTVEHPVLPGRLKGSAFSAEPEPELGGGGGFSAEVSLGVPTGKITHIHRGGLNLLSRPNPQCTLTVPSPTWGLHITERVLCKHDRSLKEEEEEKEEERANDR